MWQTAWNYAVGWVRQESAAGAALVQAFIALGVAFAWWHWSPAQTGAVMGITAALLGMFVRSQVTPIHTIKERLGKGRQAAAPPAGRAAAGPATRPIRGTVAGPAPGTAVGPGAGGSAGPGPGTAAGPPPGMGAGPIPGMGAGPVPGMGAGPAPGILPGTGTGPARPVPGTGAGPDAGQSGRWP